MGNDVRPGAVVEQMRGLSMQSSGRPDFDDGTINPKEQHKREIITQLQSLGTNAIPPLVKGLNDANAQMRRNAALVLLTLAGAYEEEQPSPEKVNIRGAMPALIKALADRDGDVRSWAAQALGEIGSDAKAAVSALVNLLKNSDEGSRNSSCIALGNIGPAARDALPTLKNALKDPSRDVRQFARRAIEQIEKRPPMGF